MSSSTYTPGSRRGAILILDDYGSWAGARKGVDEYEPTSRLFLGRLDGIARVAIKPG